MIGKTSKNLVYCLYKTSQFYKNRKYPYKFEGLSIDYQNTQSKGIQIYEYAFDSKLQDFLMQNYRNVVLSLWQNNKQYLDEVFDKKLLNQLQMRDLKLINEDANIQLKHYQHKLIIGIGSDRSTHQQSMMKLAHFPDKNTGIYLGAQQKFNPKKLKYLMQSKILYKSAMKLMPITKQKQEQSDPNKEQVHMIQYQIQGGYEPELTDIHQKIREYKNSIGMWGMLSGKNMYIQLMAKLFGINKQSCEWKVSDIDECLQGNHPTIYPNNTQKS